MSEALSWPAALVLPVLSLVAVPAVLPGSAWAGRGGERRSSLSNPMPAKITRLSTDNGQSAALLSSAPPSRANLRWCSNDA